MSRVQPVTQSRSNLKDDILSRVKQPEWTTAERALVRDFLDQDVGSDPGRFVHGYLKLVSALAAPAGMDRALVLSESGQLIAHLDPRAYDSVPVGEQLNPVEFVQRRVTSHSVRKRFDSWVQSVPLRLEAIKAQIIQTPSAMLFDFPGALLEVVRTAARSKPIPSGLEAVCNAIRLGKTSITRVDPPGLVAFYWPISGDDFADLLTAKEAVAFLKKIGKPSTIRTLFNRASIRPSLKQGAKYVKNELQKAATEGVFEQGWKAP